MYNFGHKRVRLFELRAGRMNRYEKSREVFKADAMSSDKKYTPRALLDLP
jgi:hypothetical protein